MAGAFNFPTTVVQDRPSMSLILTVYSAAALYELHIDGTYFNVMPKIKGSEPPFVYVSIKICGTFVISLVASCGWYFLYVTGLSIPPRIDISRIVSTYGSVVVDTKSKQKNIHIGPLWDLGSVVTSKAKKVPILFAKGRAAT